MQRFVSFVTAILLATGLPVSAEVRTIHVATFLNDSTTTFNDLHVTVAGTPATASGLIGDPDEISLEEAERFPQATVTGSQIDFAGADVAPGQMVAVGWSSSSLSDRALNATWTLDGVPLAAGAPQAVRFVLELPPEQNVINLKFQNDGLAPFVYFGLKLTVRALAVSFESLFFSLDLGARILPLLVPENGAFAPGITEIASVDRDELKDEILAAFFDANPLGTRPLVDDGIVIISPIGTLGETPPVPLGRFGIAAVIPRAEHRVAGAAGPTGLAGHRSAEP